MVLAQDNSLHVGKLITSTECVPPSTAVRNVTDRFFNSAHMDAVALVEGKEPVGLVTRPKLLFTLFRRYGFELYEKKPIITIADTGPLTIHEDERLDVAIDKALERPAENIYDDIIVVDDGGYYIGSKPVDVGVVVHDSPVFIVADPVKVRQILTNLTSNAAKFTDKGKIVLALGVKDSTIKISVKDTGIGIKEDDLNKLFTAFSQLEDAKTKRYEGTGLGLTITKSLLDLLGGSISVSSKFGEGTTFEVYLPRHTRGTESPL